MLDLFGVHILVNCKKKIDWWKNVDFISILCCQFVKDNEYS